MYSTQIFQKLSIKVGSLNHIGVPLTIEGAYLSLGLLKDLGTWTGPGFAKGVVNLFQDLKRN